MAGVGAKLGTRAKSGNQLVLHMTGITQPSQHASSTWWQYHTYVHKSRILCLDRIYPGYGGCFSQMECIEPSLLPGI